MHRSNQLDMAKTQIHLRIPHTAQVPCSSQPECEKFIRARPRDGFHPVIRIGRFGCDIEISHPGISRQQLEIRFGTTEIYVRNISDNVSVSINESDLGKNDCSTLRPGDIIIIVPASDIIEIKFEIVSIETGHTLPGANIVDRDL